MGWLTPAITGIILLALLITGLQPLTGANTTFRTAMDLFMVIICIIYICTCVYTNMYIYIYIPIPEDMWYFYWIDLSVFKAF